MNKSYYDILEISPGAKKDEIKAAFRNMARKFHPDVNHTIEAEILFKQVNLAAKTLLDDTLRSQYDFAYGFNKNDEQKSKKAADEARQAYKKAADEYKKQTDFAKNFHDFFTKKEKKESGLKKIDGEDIVTEVVITQKEAFEGTTAKVNILENEKCPKCFGAKFVNGSKCTFCNGEGEKSAYKKIKVKIPPNVKEGIKIRVRGQGEEGKNGGKNGDLYLVIKIEKNSIFKIINGVAHLEVPITPYEAVLGAAIRIPSYCGKTVLKIPPKTRTNTVFKLLECGFIDEKTGKRTPLMVKVVIDICPRLGDKEIELYQTLAQTDKDDIRGDLLNKYGQF